MKLFYIILISLFCLTSDASAQVTLLAPTKMVAVNEEFTVELRVTSRDSLATLQFSLTWNPAVLSFQRLDTIGGFPPSAEASEFGLTNTALGRLSSLWLDRSLRAYRVPTDSFLIFKVIFKAIGANGTSSPLQFGSVPTAMKASTVDYQPLVVTARDGLVKVGTTAVFSIYTEGSSLGQNFPNPVDNQTIIPVFLKEADDVTFEITDAIGKIFVVKKYHFEAGQHEISLNTEGSLPSGFFVYSLRTKQGLRKRILIKR